MGLASIMSDRMMEIIRQNTNRKLIEDIYRRVLKEEIPIEEFRHEEIIRSGITSRSYTVQLEENSPYDTLFQLWG